MNHPLSPVSAHGAEQAIQVNLLRPDSAQRWDDFVMNCPEATFFHLSGWQQVLERAFGHDTYYFYAERGGRIEGVLPLGHIHSRLFSNALISTPFCVYGGAVATSQAAREALDEAARHLGERLGVDYVELRNLQSHHPAWHAKDLYVTFRKTIDPDPEINLLNIPRKQRAMVRKGINAGLKSEIDDRIGRFYPAYAESVHRLGTPVFSRKFFEALMETFRQQCEVLTITHEDRVVSSVMSFYFRDEVLPYYGGGTHAARDVAGNDFMYWELMRRASERGVRIFDYGRSKKDTGAYHFKKNWGFEPAPLHYEYLLVRAKEVPDINPLNPKYRLFINLWKRLPLAVTTRVGPWISRNLG